MRDLKDVIKSLLVEKVAHGMGDSGSIYGYSHEQNDGVDFESLPAVTIDEFHGSTITSTEDVTYTINVFHYLAQLEFDAVTEAINDKLNQVRKDYDGFEDDDAPFEYPHWADECVCAVDSLYDDVEWTRESVNTYNHESFLSQVLQYRTFTIDDEYYVLVQVHGGCDIRGGYTDAVCFKLPDTHGCPVMPLERVSGDVDGTYISNSYDGYYLYGDNSEEESYEKYVPCKNDSVFSLSLDEC